MESGKLSVFLVKSDGGRREGAVGCSVPLLRYGWAAADVGYAVRGVGRGDGNHRRKHLKPNRCEEGLTFTERISAKNAWLSVALMQSERECVSCDTLKWYNALWERFTSFCRVRMFSKKHDKNAFTRTLFPIAGCCLTPSRG